MVLRKRILWALRGTTSYSYVLWQAWADEHIATRMYSVSLLFPSTFVWKVHFCSERNHNNKTHAMQQYEYQGWQPGMHQHMQSSKKWVPCVEVELNEGLPSMFPSFSQSRCPIISRRWINFFQDQDRSRKYGKNRKKCKKPFNKLPRVGSTLSHSPYNHRN